MIGYPLDSHVTYKTDGTPVWDRAISSAPYRKLIKSLFSDGVLPNPSTNLQVSAGTGMKVNLYAGFAICNGCQKLQETNMSLDIATASAVNDRIDTVILRLNDNDDVRECEFYVLTGTPAVSPVRPALTQTDSIWEIGLADVLVKANSTQISNANITDTRYETARCGIISSISEFDTTTLYQQIQADLSEFQTVTQAEVLAWFENIKSQISGDAAINLQNQIGNLTDLTTTQKGSLVEAINEVNEKEVDVLDTKEEIEANTDSGKVAGALAVKKMVGEVSASLYNLDYDNAVTLTPNTSFTPNSNGYVIVFAQSTGTYGNVGLILGNSYASIQYNSEKWLCISQQISGYNLGLNMLVKKGQQYYFHSESVTLFSARLVPFK